MRSVTPSESLSPLTADGKYTMAYVYAQASGFRALTGSKSFWTLPTERRQIAVHALTGVVFNVSGTDEEVEQANVILRSHLMEYTMRESYLVKHH